MATNGIITTYKDIDFKIALGVVDGLFKIRPIAQEYFGHSPKEFDHAELESCVFRESPVEQIHPLLINCIKTPSQPGLYLQGPSGVGKSVLTFTITQLAKFHLGWITIYVPRCEDWMKLDSPIAMGFFLERALEAFSVQHLQKKHPEIFRKLDIKNMKSSWWQRLFSGSSSQSPHLPKNINTTSWERLGRTDPGFVVTTYLDVKEFLWNQREESGTPVLLVFDEVNALWAGEERPRVSEEPWDLTSFTKTGPRFGAVLVTGTTDAEFFRTMPQPFRQANVYQVGPLTDTEVGCLQNTKLGKPLKWIHNFDEDLWNLIKDSSGNLPRELAVFARQSRTIIEPWKEEDETVDDADQEPPIKKRKLISDQVQNIRSKNLTRYKTAIDTILNIDKNEVFTRELSTGASHIF